METREKLRFQYGEMENKYDELLTDTDYDYSDHAHNSSADTSEYSLEIHSLAPEDKQRSLCFNSFCDKTRMSYSEFSSFRHFTQGKIEITAEQYFHIRNKIIDLWQSNPKEELTYEKVIGILKWHDSLKELVVKVYRFLEVHALINFGIFRKVKFNSLSAKKLRVTIIGGGISGLSAAHHLQRFGAQVMVLEARSRTGGRIDTYKKHAYVADLGGMIVTDSNENPLSTIIKQLDLDVLNLNEYCQLYEVDGKPVSSENEKCLSSEFISLLRHSKCIDVNNCNGNASSLDDAFEMAIILQERKVRCNLLNHLKAIIKLQNELIKIREDLISIKGKLSSYVAFYKEKMYQEIDITLDFEMRVMLRDIRSEIKKWDELKEQEKNLEMQLQEMESKTVQEHYLTYSDRNIINWHAAFLECKCSSPFKLLSAQHWDQHSKFLFSGKQVCISEGLSKVTNSLSDGLNISLNTVVSEINYGGEVVIVTATNSETGKSVFVESDVVLCSLPLGILKQSITPEDSNCVNKPRFNPQLPQWKENAINNLSFEATNKVVLCFSSAFWDEEVNFFGFVETSKESRGEFFLFANVTKSPVLIAFISGTCVKLLETVSDEFLVQRCMYILKKIFEKKVTTLKDSKVTRWSSDQWCRGSYSAVGINGTGDDYDLLAKPLGAEAVPRLFFAGEHTMRQCPGTLHGAMMSGLREAAQIIKMFMQQ